MTSEQRVVRAWRRSWWRWWSTPHYRQHDIHFTGGDPVYCKLATPRREHRSRAMRDRFERVYVEGA